MNEININHGLILVAKNDEMSDIDSAMMPFDENRSIIHFCGYENKPTENDKNNLIAEFILDDDFLVPGYSGVPAVLVASDEIVQEFIKIIKENAED
jgi:hypothetical protein